MVKVKRTVKDFIEIELDGEEVELEVRLAPGPVMHYAQYVIERPVASLLVVGYLIDDGDCPDPLEDCDGMGKVYSSHRHALRESQRGMQKALGLNEHWNPAIPDDMWAAAEATCKQNDPTDVSPNYDKICVEAEKLFRAARERGEIGDPYAVSLDVYEHSGTHYSISGEGMQCQWDTARGGAVWVPDDSCREHIEACLKSERRAEAVNCARQAISEYNKWLAGDCYGRIIVSYERAQDGTWSRLEDDDSEVWGFIGSEYAHQTLKEDCAAQAKYLLSSGKS